MVNGFVCWWSGTGSLLLLFYMCFFSFLFLAVLFSKQQSFYNQTGKEEGGGEQIYTENGIFYCLRDGIRIYFWQFLTICSVPGKDKLVCCSSCFAAMMHFLLLWSVSRKQRKKFEGRSVPACGSSLPSFLFPFPLLPALQWMRTRQPAVLQWLEAWLEARIQPLQIFIRSPLELGGMCFAAPRNVDERINQVKHTTTCNWERKPAELNLKRALVTVASKC